MSYFFVNNSLQYFTIFATTPSSTQNPPQQIENQFSYSSANLVQNSQRSGSLPSLVHVLGDSSANMVQNAVCPNFQNNQTAIDLNRVQSRISISTSPIVLSFNSQSNIFINRDQPVSLDIITQNKKQAIKQLTKLRASSLQDNNQYLPHSQRKRKPQVKYQQNNNRNIIPNSINQIFSFIQKKDKSALLVYRLFEKFTHDQNFTAKRFYLYQSLLKISIGHYTNERSLRILTNLYEPACISWSYQEQQYYIKITRCLIYHFLHEESIFITLTSKRMKSGKKYDHLRARRQVYQSVLRIIKGY